MQITESVHAPALEAFAVAPPGLIHAVMAELGWSIWQVWTWIVNHPQAIPQILAIAAEFPTQPLKAIADLVALLQQP